LFYSIRMKFVVKPLFSAGAGNARRSSECASFGIPGNYPFEILDNSPNVSIIELLLSRLVVFFPGNSIRIDFAKLFLDDF
jgi:hypothetical protein